MADQQRKWNRKRGLRDEIPRPEKEAKMRIAVSAAGRRPDSPIDARFGRAGYFQIFDTDTGEYEVIDNTGSRESMQGAGVQAGELIAGKEVSVAITGHCGPKAFRVLAGAGVKVMLCGGGTVDQAIEKFMKGGLDEAAGPDVKGHWG
jgi:predicted Fe-Mo cluster-binding NifX family protein